MALYSLGSTIAAPIPPRTRMLVAGGCHVNGYPIGESSSFSALAANKLGHDCDRVAPISLRNPSALFKHMVENPLTDVLILQFGNYEAPMPLGKHFRAVIATHQGWMTNHLSHFSSSSKKWLVLPPEQVFEPSLKWKIRVALKQRYADVAQQLQPPLFDPRAVRQSLRSLLDRLAPYRIPMTVVLSPLPCADHMARRFRIEAASIFREEAEATGALFLDTAQVLGYFAPQSRREFDIYADERHLNARGHRLLADALIATLATTSLGMSEWETGSFTHSVATEGSHAALQI